MVCATVYSKVQKFWNNSSNLRDFQNRKWTTVDKSMLTAKNIGCRSVTRTSSLKNAYIASPGGAKASLFNSQPITSRRNLTFVDPKEKRQEKKLLSYIFPPNNYFCRKCREQIFFFKDECRTEYCVDTYILQCNLFLIILKTSVNTTIYN